MPLVSIVTPTIPGREEQLINRCIPSVRNQWWGGMIEHVIVSDINPDLRQYFRRFQNDCLRFVEINDTWRSATTMAANGAMPWMLGSRLAFGEFIGFLGDDDELLPSHVRLHTQAMKDFQCFWSLSKVEFRAHGQFWNVIGDISFLEGHLDATGIMCTRTALNVATWDPASGYPAVDWKLVNDWRMANLPGTFIDEVTGIHHDGWLTGHTGKPYSEEPWAGHLSQ